MTAKTNYRKRRLIFEMLKRLYFEDKIPFELLELYLTDDLKSLQ